MAGPFTLRSSCGRSEAPAFHQKLSQFSTMTRLAAGSSRWPKSLPLPPNIKVVRLPDTDLARNYPSVGPQGRTRLT
jgi:hypothetical protein